jgi:hypothetical protein
MKEFRMRAFFGILGLAGAGFMISSVTSVGGCSSSSGGSTGTAGSSSSGTAGTTGSAGTLGNGGNGGSGGGGGASAAVGCITSELAPNPAPIIADFTSVDGGASIPIGGTFTYASPTGAVAPTATVTAGGWHIVLNAPGMATASQYIGVGIYFNGNAAGDACIDGTPYTGIKFDISGTVAGTMCSVQYATNDSGHADAVANPSDKKAGGPAGSYAPQAAVTVSSTVTTMMVPFVGGSLGTGSPATPIDKSKLTGVQWQFTVGPGATSACMVDLVIDNVSFY